MTEFWDTLACVSEIDMLIHKTSFITSKPLIVEVRLVGAWVKLKLRGNKQHNEDLF